MAAVSAPLLASDPPQPEDREAFLRWLYENAEVLKAVVAQLTNGVSGTIDTTAAQTITVVDGVITEIV